MGKMFICITVILSICLTISGCNVLKCKEPEQTQPGIVIESNPLNRNIELTMYTGLQTVHDPQRKKMIDDIINELNVLSGSMIGITVRLVYSDSRLSEPLWTDDVPDINIATRFASYQFFF